MSISINYDIYELVKRNDMFFVKSLSYKKIKCLGNEMIINFDETDCFAKLKTGNCTIGY